MTYSIDIVNLFIKHHINGVSIMNIAKMLNISRLTLYRWLIKYKYNIDNKQSVTNHNLKNSIHKLYKLSNYNDKIIKYVNNNEGCTLENIKNHINNELSNSSICRILKIHNITRKRISRRIISKPIEQIIEDRKNFSKKIKNKEFEHAIYLDESSFCVSDYSNYGYSKKGNEIQKLEKHKRNKETKTLIAAINKNKIVAYKILDTSVNKEIYLNFLKENICIFKNKILIQDNARVHHSKVVKEYALKEMINMKYNPAYSPEFNPIELSFNKMKTIFRKLKHDNLNADIKTSINSITSNDLKKFYKKTKKVIDNYRKLK